MRKKNWPPKIDSEENRDRAFNYSLKYLSFRARSTKEIKDYLVRKNFIEATIDAAIQKLNELKFLNDEGFAKAWIESRQKHKGKSKFVLKQELRIKGIDSGMIDHTLQEAQEDFETARILFEKKKKLFQGLSKIEFKKRMGAYLQRRGFTWEIIKKLLREN